MMASWGFALNLATQWCIYALAVVPVTLLAGQGGMLTLAQGAFYGAGAYAAALVALHQGWGILGSGLVAFLVASLLAVVSGALLGRLKGDAFILASLALVVGCSALANNWMSLTRGPRGLAGIPKPSIGECCGESSRHEFFFYLVALLVGLLWVYVIASGRIGLRLRATREGTTFAKTLGERVVLVRSLALVLAAGVTGVAGALHAHYLQYVDPSVFDTDFSLMFLAIALVGGVDRVKGALVGASIFVALPGGLRLLEFASPSEQKDLNQILFGLAVLGILLVRPQGICGSLDITSTLATDE